MPLYAILHGMPESEERKRLEDICRSINAIKISQQSYIYFMLIQMKKLVIY